MPRNCPAIFFMIAFLCFNVHAHDSSSNDVKADVKLPPVTLTHVKLQIVNPTKLQQAQQKLAALEKIHGQITDIDSAKSMRSEFEKTAEDKATLGMVR